MEGRYELKFVVDGEIRRRVLAALRQGLSPDPHARRAVYRVSSLYFDTPDHSAYWEKIDGQAVRRKYRLRYYSARPDTAEITAAFMEIKHRIHNSVYKQRVKLTDLGARTILSNARQLGRLGQHLRQPQERDRVLAEQIQLQATRANLTAATVITYLREAWIGTVDHQLRVTFDSRCRALRPANYLDVKSNQGNGFLDERQLIMEVKFNRAIPCWVRDVLVDQQLVLQRFSKYAEGLVRTTGHALV